MTIGIGITTRNRPKMLEMGLAHFKEFGWGNEIVVIDDNSDDSDTVMSVIKNSGIPCRYYRSEKRLGIANAKNACLYELQSHSDVFLFDDDAWPRKIGWAENWVETNRQLGVGHSMYLLDIQYVPGANPALRVPFNRIDSVTNGTYTLYSFNNCMGLLLYFSRECLDKIGGYDSSAKNVYGYEHAQMSQRAKEAGMSAGHNYLSPSNAYDLIYSMDVNYNWVKELPPLVSVMPSGLGISVTDEERNLCTRNEVLMRNFPMHIPIVSPLQ